MFEKLKEHNEKNIEEKREKALASYFISFIGTLYYYSNENFFLRDFLFSSRVIEKYFAFSFEARRCELPRREIAKIFLFQLLKKANNNYDE